LSINLLSTQDIDDEVVVFDGGNKDNPPLRPPDGLIWRCISINDGRHIYVDDETDPGRGLTFARVNNALPFNRLPRSMSLRIIGNCGLRKIYNALEACKKLRKISLVQSDRKRVFGDYGKPVRYTCAGIQVSRNSCDVVEFVPHMDKLATCHWEALIWIMRCAELGFEELADHQVISHMWNAKNTVPFKTMPLSNSTKSSCKYYGGLAFGCNVFLWCHTDEDFTMSIVQVFVNGKETYHIDNSVVIYFCFPTLGVAVPLRPGDYLMFNSLVPHCVSSRCNNRDDVIVLSMYMKTSIVQMKLRCRLFCQKDSNHIYHRNYVHQTVDVMYRIDMIHFIKRFNSNTLSEYLYRVCLSILSPNKRIQLRFGKTTMNDFLSPP
jgi:hypothetical protein